MFCSPAYSLSSELRIWVNVVVAVLGLVVSVDVKLHRLKETHSALLVSLDSD